MRKKNILITGSEGYIATNFINIYGDKYDFTLVDKKNGIRCEELKNIDDIDCIIHLAAVSGIDECENNIEEAIKSNISASYNIFNLAFEEGIDVIFASSQAVKIPKASIYAFTKSTCEIEALRLNKLGGTNKILRFTNIFGGEYYLEKKNSVIAKFLKAKLKDETLVIHGDGEQVRDFLAVEDACRAIDMCINKNKLPFPLDIGTGLGTKIIDIAREISPNFMFTGAETQVGVVSSIADTLSAQDFLGFNAVNKVHYYIQSFL